MSKPESRYSFDVPNICIDFATLNEDDMHNADSWFDEKANLENVPPAENLAEVSHRSPAFSKPDVILSSVPLQEVAMSESDGEAECAQGNTVPQNIVGSLATWRAGAPAEAPQRPGRRLATKQGKTQQRKQPGRIKAERIANALDNKEDVPPLKKMRLSGSREKVTETSTKKEPLQDPDLSPGRGKSKQTMPSTPTMLKRTKPSSKPKSTEEQEVEKMQQLQQEVMELRKKNEESLKAAIAGAGQPMKKPVGQVTKPINFHFCTENRIKQNVESQPVNEYKELDFAAVLRKHPPSPVRMPKGHTVPKPFNLSQGNKRKLEEATTEYVSFAEQVEAFQKRTPPRYHLRSRKSEEGSVSKKPVKAQPTHPKTPVLRTKHRLRPVTCKTAAELEAEEVEKIQQYKFKAREINHKIFEGGPLLPKKPPVKKLTQPIGFQLEIEKRIQERESKKQQEEERFEFHSRPCPTKILEDVVGVPEKKALPVTVPKSPAFTLRSRTHVSGREEEKGKEEVAVIKANPMPHYGVPFKPKMPEQRHVEVCPFSFDARDRERQIQKEKKIEELQKEEVPKFKALPLPYFDEVKLPEKKVKTPTQPEPFHLHVDERGAAKLQSWKQQLEEDLKRQKEAACFKARPNTVVYQEPFVPKKEHRMLSESLSGSVVPESFELATERRAKERQEFEKRLAEAEALREKYEEQIRQKQEQREKEEVAKLRQEMVHKANPIRKYRSLEVKSSHQPLTVPKSPNFSDRFRC
ncbi:targeting protein for Xklp2 isoform X1 [Haemorhous mexicanus]|uniref:targeting protein for Xklp2 isoform X1 n=1 Tax=Haemorhous mexicanus TaxID=30427 RepID=UPI0028BE8CF5|nr:targeting protein for Xklp2 isoform X1 [Haemorhous mexicanus]XP_059718422.1 targeting protein for Xklp2 isoform X1 [Haemorhous mexicanus]XP_059718423.1 targeting protein for Xklp2 isoform X1 [Haemorhous mexicanus]